MARGQSSSDQALPEHWLSADTRADGLTISEDTADSWVVFDRDGDRLIEECPCCDRPLRTRLAARLVCDALYPFSAAQQAAGA